MLKNKIENNNEIKCLYESSNILGSIYNTRTSDLIIIFNRGSQYKYKNVTKQDYIRFEIAESQGKELNSNIKVNYIFDKMDNIDPIIFINEFLDNNNEKEILNE